jgi:hypothetical protein
LENNSLFQQKQQNPNSSYSSVACGIGPSVNTLKAQHFFLPSPIFAICLNFQQQNSLKNQYLPHLSSENCEINSIKSDSPKASKQHEEHLQIPINFSISFHQ